MDLRNESINQPLSVNSDGIVKVDLKEKSAMTPSQESEATRPVSRWWTTDHIRAVLNSCAVDETSPIDVYNIIDCPAEWRDAFGTRVLRLLFKTDCFTAAVPAMPLSWPRYTGEVKTFPLLVPNPLALLTHLDHPDVLPLETDPKIVAAACHPMVQTVILDVYRNIKKPDGLLENVVRASEEVVKLSGAAASALEQTAAQASAVSEVVQAAGKDLAGAASTGRKVLEQLKEYLEKVSAGVSAAFNWSSENVIALLKSPCELVKTIFDWLKNRCSNWIGCLGALLKNPEFYGLLSVALLGLVSFTLVWGAQSPPFLRILVGFAAAADLAYCGISCFNMISDLMIACPQDRFQALASDVWNILLKVATPIGKMAQGAGINSIWQFFMGVVRAKDGIAWTWNAALDFFRGFVNTVSEALGIKDFIYFHSISPVLEEWMKKAHDFVTAAVQKRVGSSDLVALRVLHSEGSQLAGAGGCRLPETVKRPFMDLLNEIRRVIGAARPIGAFHKMQPFLTLFTGDPGLGKTVAVLQSIVMMLMRPGVFSQEIRDLWKKDPSAVLFTFAPEIRYDTGLKRQVVGIIDEWLASVNPADPASEWLRILRMCNELVSPTEQAAIEDKGQVNEMEAVFVTSNTKVINAAGILRDPRAPVRRCDLIVKVLPNEEDGYYYNASLGRIVQSDENGKLTPLEPSEGYNMFNTNCLRFGIAKGEIVYKGRKVTCTLGNDFAIPDDYVYKVTFAELVDIIARGIIRNREKFGSADDDLKTTARVVEEMYFGDVIDDSVPQAEVQKFDLDAARFVLALALKLEPKFPNARARLLRLSQNRLFRIWQLSYAPRVMEQTAAEFLQLQAGEEEALVGTFSEKVVQLLERKFNALVLTFHSFRTTAVSFLKRFGWLIGIVLGVAGLGVGVYLAWDWIKSVVPSAIISMFSVVPQAVNYLGNVGATDVVAELAKSRKQGYDKGLDDALPLLTRNEWAVIAQEDKKGHTGQNPDFIAKLFCVRGRQYLCTKHVYDRWVDLGYASRKTLVRLVRVMEPAKPIEVDLCEVLNTMEPVEDNDEHVWLWMPSVVPSCYDMTHFLFPKALLASWVGPQFQFECHPVRQDPKTGALERHHFYGLGLQTSKIRIQSRPVYAFAYPMATQTGDCMTPIYVNNPRVPTSRVLGFHVAGSPNTGFACYVSKEAAQSKPFDKLGKGVRSVHNAKPQAHLERQDTISGNMSHYVLDVQPRINRKHELVPSPLSGFTNAIRGLPAMFPVDGKDPYLNQNAKVLRPRPLGDLALLKACARSYFHNVLGRLPVTVPPVSMLTQTQVLKGDPSYHLAALGKDHYAGFMWREGFQGTPKEEAYVKKYASRFPYLGREGDHPLDPELLYLIEAAVKRDYAAASQDEALCEPIKRDLKSELRSETPTSVLDHYKFVPFSTTRYPEDSQRSYKPPRFIAAFGLPHQWRVKQCFGSFLAHFLNTRLWAMHTLGINVAGSEADTLARLLHRLRLIETDFAECDYSLLGCLSEEIVHNVEETFFKQAPDWHPDHAQYRKAIAVEIFHSLYIMMEDGKYKAFSSDCNGTGSGLTAFMTTAQAIILGMYSAARILERRNISTVDFLNNPCTYLRSVYNGDDSIAAFTEKFPQFPAPEFALGFKEWGCDAVDPISKVATTLEFKSLTEVSFLKRHFRWHDVAQRWVLAMSFDVIHDLPLFVLRGGDALSQCMVRCDLGIMEAAAHDRLTYDMVAEYYEYLWRCFGKTFISPPYESAFRSRCALEDKVGVRPADDPLDVEPQSDTQRLQFVQANANVDANTPKGVEVVERSVAKAPSNPPNSIFRLMQSPILCATGSLTNTTAKGRVTTLGPFQTLYNNSSEFAALLEQYQSFSGRIRFTWQFTANYKNMGRVALRVDPRGPYQRLASNTIPATWQQNADAVSRLPGAYAYLADTNFLFVDVDFISTQSFFQLNSDLDTISSKGPDVILSVEGSLNGGIAQTYPYVILCTLLELKMGPVAPLAGSTPATPLQIQPQSDLLRAGAAAAEATGTIMDKIAGVAANATAAFPIAAEVGAGVAVAAKTGAMLAKPVSSVLSTFADAAGALGFTHDPPGIMYTQQNPSANQFNSNGPMFYQDLHMTHGYGTAPPMDADLSETNVAVLGSKYNIYSANEMLLQPVASTPTGTVLGSVYVNPQANDASTAAGGRTYYPSPSGAFFASSKFGRWGVETIKVRLGNCGPKLVAGKIRAVFYSYCLEQSGGAPTFAYKLSEAAPHKDWDLSVSRETELEFDVPMNVSMVPMNVNMGQVDFIVLSPLATNVGDVTQVPICVEVAFGGLRVGWLRDADVVPLLASLISDGISCDAVPQADTSTLERVAAHLSAGPPTKADVPARSMELCLDLLSVLKIAHQVYTLPTSGSNYIIVYPPALQCANVVSGSYVGGGSFISACLLAYAFWQGDFILGTYSLRAPTIGNMGNVYMYDPLVYCQTFTATAMQTFVSTAAFGTPTVRTAPINNYSNMVRIPMDSSVAWLPSIPSDPLGTTPITIQNDSMGAACVITPPTATAGTYLWPSWAKSLTMQAADMRVKMYCGAPPLVLLSSALANVGLLKARRVRGAPSLDDERPLALKRGAEQRKGVNHASLALSGLGSGRNV